MSAATCPHCNSTLPPEQIAEGWCENCGKRIPSFVTNEAKYSYPGLAGLPRYEERDISYRPITRSTLASPLSRLGAAFLDGLFYMLLTGPGYVLFLTQDTKAKQPDEAILFLGLFLLGVGLLIVLVVQITLLTMTGQTVGKKIVGVRIVLFEDEGPPGFVHAWLLRSFVPGLIGAIPCIGAIFSLVDILFIFSEDHRCVHDHIAGTKVVDA